jgi:hypothetical protein
MNANKKTGIGESALGGFRKAAEAGRLRHSATKIGTFVKHLFLVMQNRSAILYGKRGARMSTGKPLPSILVSEQQVEAVYNYIWEYLKANDELPSRREIAEALIYSMAEVHECVALLRQAGLLAATTLLPTGYRQWWRDNLRTETRWTQPRIIPLRPKLPRQMPLWEAQHG